MFILFLSLKNQPLPIIIMKECNKMYKKIIENLASIYSLKICSEEIEEGNPTEICYSCQSIMSNMNLRVDGF